MKTIAAISTAAGIGGIGIIRISGDKALDITKKVFKPKNNTPYTTYTFKLGYIIDENNNVIDQALVSYFKSPKTYTGEDVCEINSHGGTIVLKKILELVLRAGAVLAEPGEFTKRAFLNGKMDLTQAEAVIELINSKSDKENKTAIKQLEGELGENIRMIKDDIVSLLVDIEANIDYPEYDIEEVRREKILEVLSNSSTKLKKLEDSFETGKIIKSGISTAIVGKPNVGKSSLLNRLVNEERAIVTNVAGTTRDTIEEYITIKGIPLKIIDTAGIHETSDLVEEIGVSKSKKALNDADLVLVMLDASTGITKEDVEVLESAYLKNHIVLINKIDIENKINKEDIKSNNIIEISTKTLEGIETLEEKIETMFNFTDINVDDSIIVTNVRHKDLIIKTKDGIRNAINSLNNSIPIDMISIDLQNIVQNLGEIIGESISEDVLNGIFKKFCVGK